MLLAGRTGALVRAGFAWMLLAAVVEASPADPGIRNQTERNMNDDRQDVSADQLRAHGLQQLPITLNGRSIVLTLADVTQIQQALHTFLSEHDAGDSGWHEHRADLLSNARDAGYIGRDGVVRIGRWLLDASGEPVLLRIRIPGYEGAPAAPGYLADLDFDTAWRVKSVRLERLRRAR